MGDGRRRIMMEGDIMVTVKRGGKRRGNSRMLCEAEKEEAIREGGRD